MTHYWFKKPKEWSMNEWSALICILAGAYPVDAGQTGPNDYEVDVRVDNQYIIDRINCSKRKE